jgi:hypothetical protein
VISGTPTQSIASTTFTVTATNANGSNSATVNLSVVGVAPTISYSAANVHTALGTQNSSVSLSPNLFTGGLSITCSINPDLPTGLSIDPNTCVISGTPTIASPSASYTVTATNSVASATASFNYFVCPANYVAIAANSSFYNSAFCVAKYEMRCVGTDCATVVPARTGPTLNTTATSQPSGGIVWSGMLFSSSKTACENIDGVGTRYTIINNPQWMNIAREIEFNNANWSSGIRWTGMLNTGHTDGNPAGWYLSTAGADSDPYSGTNNSELDNLNAGWEQKRTHLLSSGKVIWDLGGNLDEWVDWTVARSDRAYRSSDGGVIYRDPITNNVVAINLTELDTNISSGSMISSAWFPAGGSMLISDGFGAYIGGRTTDAVDPVLRRGRSGIYGTNAFYDDSDPSIGFRCVYLP